MWFKGHQRKDCPSKALARVSPPKSSEVGTSANKQSAIPVGPIAEVRGVTRGASHS